MRILAGSFRGLLGCLLSALRAAGLGRLLYERYRQRRIAGLASTSRSRYQLLAATVPMAVWGFRALSSGTSDWDSPHDLPGGFQLRVLACC